MLHESFISSKNLDVWIFGFGKDHEPNTAEKQLGCAEGRHSVVQSFVQGKMEAQQVGAKDEVRSFCEALYAWLYASCFTAQAWS